MTNWTPTAGDRIARAWYAILKVLTGDASGAGSTWMALRNAAENGSDIQPKTVNNLISDAVKHGYLERKAGMYFLTSLGASTIPTNPPTGKPTTPSDNVPSLAPALTAADLDAIEARVNAATEGPWTWRQDEPGSLVIEHQVAGFRMHPTNVLKAPDWGPTLSDAAFIAAARTDVPVLVAALRQAWRSRDTWVRVEAETRAEMHARLAEHRDAVEVLKLRLSEVTGERDRARSVAVALEGEVALLRQGIEERIAGWSSHRTDPASLTAASCAEALRRLLTPQDAQEPAQEPRTGAGGPGVPDEGCEAVSGQQWGVVEAPQDGGE